MIGQRSTSGASVEGPLGKFRVELHEDDRWSVEQTLSEDRIKCSKFVRDSEGRFGWETYKEAMNVAANRAGLIPYAPPDRRGLVAHSRALHG
jgi:hypothetical protein